LNGCAEIHAYIAPDNTVSLICFAACGYVFSDRDADDMLDYVYKKQ
jgi:hypothetical protein